MKLIGSTTSPYVRRIRLLLAGQDYEFVNLDIYGADRDELRRQNPALKIPMLVDGDQVVYDSRVISRDLSAKLGLPALDWDQENQLTLIDAANDSFVTLLLSKRSGLDIEQDAMFYRLQWERVAKTLAALAEMVRGHEFEGWTYPSICLYCLVDWLDFRELLGGEARETLLAFRDTHREREAVKATDPRSA
ncbi:MAG: glutathione S-transferase N-terminal domain-containing protein [Marinobacter sp.]|uniref:glutathione S-transferase family protein n=1 Tax=Marinobacter sp. TaxID=50741 RepID=UPI00299DBFF0|nr:glutathione S-transferase N-terminal domain-containing protein [Marinobacter sp.]MDX1756345.1 glutathione S-transferase N-terminal domain-containing protein [Marinobacter sp.]